MKGNIEYLKSQRNAIWEEKQLCFSVSGNPLTLWDKTISFNKTYFEFLHYAGNCRPLRETHNALMDIIQDNKRDIPKISQKKTITLHWDAIGDILKLKKTTNGIYLTLIGRWAMTDKAEPADKKEKIFFCPNVSKVGIQLDIFEDIPATLSKIKKKGINVQGITQKELSQLLHLMGAIEQDKNPSVQNKENE